MMYSVLLKPKKTIYIRLTVSETCAQYCACLCVFNISQVSRSSMKYHLQTAHYIYFSPTCDHNLAAYSVIHV